MKQRTLVVCTASPRATAAACIFLVQTDSGKKSVFFFFQKEKGDEKSKYPSQSPESSTILEFVDPGWGDEKKA